MQGASDERRVGGSPPGDVTGQHGTFAPTAPAQAIAPGAQPVRPLEDDVPPGQPGPGLRPRDGIDPTIVAGAVFVAIGFTPVGWWERLFNAGHFGPIQLPAIMAMVGVLFGFIALLRSVDLGDRQLRTFAVVVLVAGLIRLFVVPLGA